jgi:hypothetical protein
VDRPDRHARRLRTARRLFAAPHLAAAGIARNTANIRALDATIEVATDMLGATGAVARKLDTVAGVLEQRSR